MRRPTSLVAAVASLLLVLHAPSALASDDGTCRDPRTMEQSCDAVEPKRSLVGGPEMRADRKPQEQLIMVDSERCSGYGPKRNECLLGSSQAQVPQGEQETVCPRRISPFEEEARCEVHRIWSDPTKNLSGTKDHLEKKNQTTNCLTALSKPINCSSDEYCKMGDKLLAPLRRHINASSVVDWLRKQDFLEPTCGASYLRGYRFDVKSGMWQDKDECRENTSDCDHECENTVGSFRCKCRPGYFLQRDRKSGLDVDGCRLNRAKCAQKCENTEGSFRCSCRPGFYLLSDGKSCADINECRRNKTLCSQICINTVGSYKCACYPGFFLMEDQESCDDEDECAFDKYGRRKAPCTHTCTNRALGFMCSCPAGYVMNKHNPAECLDIRTAPPGSYDQKCLRH